MCDLGMGAHRSLEASLVSTLAQPGKCTKECRHSNVPRLCAYMYDMGMGAHTSLVSTLAQANSMCNVHIDISSRRDSCLDSTINDHIKCGELLDALTLYQTMQENAPQLSECTFVAVLKACASSNNIGRGYEIHADIARNGLLETNLFVGNSLIDMYIKCGSLAKAEEAFHSLPVRDVITWTTIIGGYAELDYDEGAVNCFKQMQLEGICPNSVTFICVLKACAGIRAADKGREMHAMIAKSGLLTGDVVVSNTLLDMYAKCGLLVKAQEVFDDSFLVRNIVSWNSLISGFTQHECGEDALRCLEQMRMEGILPNAITVLCSLNACGSSRSTHTGTHLYAIIANQGWLEKRDLVLGNALVDMFVKCGSLTKAQEVFDLLLVRDVVTWSSLIAGYAQHDHSEESLYLFEQMQFEGVTPNAITFACSLKACGSIRAIDKAKEIHGEIVRSGLLGRDIVVGNALVDMYAKCGLLVTAQEVFDKLRIRDVVSWNSLITGYLQHDQAMEALHCFQRMQRDGVPPNALTLACVLNGCGSLGAADMGKDIHDEIVWKGLLKGHLMVGSALVTMYAKCGVLSKAQGVFDELLVRDAVIWNSLITGYAQLGEVENVLHAFTRMRADGNTPDVITFLSILNACSHAGLVDEGVRYFMSMERDFSLARSVEHYICILDLLSRAGQLNKAMEAMKEMPFHPNNVMLLILLGACRKWGNVELAIQAFEQALQVDEGEAAAYLCMFNIYADADMEENELKYISMERTLLRVDCNINSAFGTL